MLIRSCILCRFYCRFYFRFWLPLFLPFCKTYHCIVKRKRATGRSHRIEFSPIPEAGSLGMNATWGIKGRAMVLVYSLFTLYGSHEKRSCSLPAGDWPTKTVALNMGCIYNEPGPHGPQAESLTFYFLLLPSRSVHSRRLLFTCYAPVTHLLFPKVVLIISTGYASFSAFRLYLQVSVSILCLNKPGRR